MQQYHHQVGPKPRAQHTLIAAMHAAARVRRGELSPEHEPNLVYHAAEQVKVQRAANWADTNVGRQFRSNDAHPPDRARNQCAYCGDVWTLNVMGAHVVSHRLTQDHIVPKILGGAKKNQKNICLACPPCNNAKGGLLLRGIEVEGSIPGVRKGKIPISIDWAVLRQEVAWLRGNLDAVLYWRAKYSNAMQPLMMD